MSKSAKILALVQKELRRLAQQDRPDPVSVGRWNLVRRLLTPKPKGRKRHE